jgi:hypothetical protein
MKESEVLDSILLNLADVFEGGDSHRFATIEPSSVEEYEPLRECIAGMVAEGSLLNYMKGCYRLTPAGYAKYKPRISALRALGSTDK